MHEKDVIAGRNAVSEAIKSGRPIEALHVRRGEGKSGSIIAILAKAKEKGILIKETDGRKLDQMCDGANHQGIVAIAGVKEYAQLQDIFDLAESRGEPPFIIICDELSDPHNLGAILRTAECTGAHGVIIPKRRSAGLSFTVGKASAGAVEYVPVVRVNNITDTLRTLKEKGLWVYAGDFGGTTWCEVDYQGPVALVIGSEGSGISRLVKENSDFIVSLPMQGNIKSLNASVAAGVFCYEILRQRTKMKSKNP